MGGAPDGLAFWRSNYVIYGGPAFEIIYVPTWPLGISWWNCQAN